MPEQYLTLCAAHTEFDIRRAAPAARLVGQLHIYFIRYGKQTNSVKTRGACFIEFPLNERRFSSVA